MDKKVAAPITSGPARCSSVGAVPTFDRMVLLVRHAERFAVTDVGTSATVMLTEQGHADARALGRQIAARFGAVDLWHSPVPRCRQTAEGLAVGGAARLRGPLDWLSGRFIGGEPRWINQQIATHGDPGFLRLWLDGAFEGRIASLAEAAGFVLRQVLAQLQGLEQPVGVDVTHDWVLMLLRERYLGLRHEEVGVPGFLDSVCALRRGDRTMLWSLGCCVEVGGVDERGGTS